jgi:hypothetical protein
MIIWNEEGCFKIQTFGMQSICSSEQGEERERKTYTSSSGGKPPWIRVRLQYVYKFYFPSSGKCIVSNQAQFDEESYPYRNQDMIRGKLDEDNNLEILSVDKLLTRWIDFTPEINLDQYEKVHVRNGEHYKLRSETEQDVFMKVSREAFFQSLLQRNSNEVLSKARGLLSRMEAELVNTPVGGP